MHIAWLDAAAYAKWAGKRLPTEAEFEFAARGGLARKKFAWGDEFHINGKAMANTYQSTFPTKDSGEDGSAGIAPVAQFPPNGYGPYDMAGNVWQWCGDWYRADYYAQLAAGAAWPATRKAPIPRWIRRNLKKRNACSAAARSYAPTNTARATSSAPAAKEKSPPAATMWGLGA